MITSDTTRVLDTGEDAEAALQLKNKEATLIGNDKNFVTVDDRGVTIRGPISLLSTGESTRKSGIFIGLNDFLQMLPSCIVVPLPRNIEHTPTFMMGNIAKDLAFFMAFLI